MEEVTIGDVVRDFREALPHAAIYVYELAVPLDIDGELTCDWRDGCVW